MTELKEIYGYLKELAPLELAEDWDNPGLLVDCGRPVGRVLTCLDITGPVVREAQEKGCDLVVSHHPVIFRPLKALQEGQVPCLLLKAGISAICMHTNLDAAPGGVNDTLAQWMGLREVEPFAEGMGRIGWIEEMSAHQLAQETARILHARVQWADGGKPIRRLALITGSGGSMLEDAIRAGADALLTGEASHHAALDALAAGVTLVAAGHYATEFPVAQTLATRLGDRFRDLEVLVSEMDRDPYHYL
ncbi:Nif3-like dinuclear metal center hexameric protein [Fournierella massiliensis]|nr:Nif3-like dinuclear metal center hexameric protein [Fournierella massiliensis]MCF2556504.1 Nif3-like dinuclear metal center hexameric protein [Fournierella massiliensis]